MPKVVDTFLYASGYEKEVLLTKLHCEDPVVDQWVLVDCAETFRGEFKGLSAKDLIAGDSRFAPFRDRIHVVELPHRPYQGKPGYHTYYLNEKMSREAAFPFVRDNFSDEDWVIVADCDEMVDGTDPERRSRFLGLLNQHGDKTVYLAHKRFWWDFDSATNWPFIYSAFARLGELKAGRVKMSCRVDTPSRHIHIPAGDNPIMVEYSFCFAREGCWAKLCSFVHDGYRPQELDDAIATNSWVKSAARGERPGDGAWDWFEVVELTPANSPKYVRDNLDRLKTNLIPADYRENRKRLYGV
jgi:hypothetical protein